MGKIKLQLITRLCITDLECGDCLRDYKTITTYEGGYSDIESAKACLIQGAEQAKHTIEELKVR